MAEQFFYIVAGLTYTIVDNVHIFFLGEDGFGQEDLEISEEETPYEDGATEIGVHVPPRRMAVAIGIKADSDSELKTIEDDLAHKLRPSRGVGVLRRITADGRTRDIAARLARYPKSWKDKRGPLYAERVLTFHGSYPYFYDPTEQVETFALDTPGGLTFPIEFVEGVGVTLAESDVDSEISVSNTGDVASWPRVRVYGPGGNPQIDNQTTGKVFALTNGGGVLLDEGDYIDIDMEAGTVDWYDASAGTTTSIIEKISAASEFWRLEQGENIIRGRLANATTGSIVLYFRLWYDHV